MKKVTAPYKYPRILEFVDELPKTVSGKIQRKLIRTTDKDTDANRLVVRRAEISDAGVILSYLNMIGGESDNLAFGADGFSHMSEEQECAYIASMTGRSALLLGFIGDEIAAIASLEGKNRERAAHRANLVITVRQKFWHRGIGTQMMNKLLEHAREQGITVIETHVRADNNVALSLYEKLGFERIGTYRRFFRIDEQDYDAELLNLYL